MIFFSATSESPEPVRSRKAGRSAPVALFFPPAGGAFVWSVKALTSDRDFVNLLGGREIKFQNGMIPSAEGPLFISPDLGRFGKLDLDPDPAALRNPSFIAIAPLPVLLRRLDPLIEKAVPL